MRVWIGSITLFENRNNKIPEGTQQEDDKDDGEHSEHEQHRKRHHKQHECKECYAMTSLSRHE